MGAFVRAITVVIAVAALRPVGAAGETRYAVPLGDSPAIGVPGAPVVIVEFIDYQ